MSDVTTTVPTSVSTPATVESAVWQYEIAPGVFVDQATYDIIKAADQQATRPSRNLIPEIKVVSTDKQVLDFSSLLGKGIAKGTFVAISYDENGDKIYSDLGPTFQAVLLKNTNAYTLYDEVEMKSTHFTNEYEFGVQNRIMLKRAEDDRVLFDGSQKDLKGFLITNFPAKPRPDGTATHQFSFRNVLYVVLPHLIKERGPGAVFRLMLSHTSLDGVNDFKHTISGDAMKYLAEFSTTPKMNGTNLAYPLQIKVAGDVVVLAKLGVLPEIAQMKKDIDELVLQIQEHFFSTGEGSVAANPQIAAPTPAPTPIAISTAQPSATAPGVAESVFGGI